MFFNKVVFNVSKFSASLYCFNISFAYVACLYLLANNNLRRDDPVVIKGRFIRVTIVCILAQLTLWLISINASELQTGYPLMLWLGYNIYSLFPTMVSALSLTMILFLGPIVQNSFCFKNSISINNYKLNKNNPSSKVSLFSKVTKSQYLYSKYWIANFKDVYWLRSHVVGPITEELVYRACMLPVLVPQFGELTSIIISPLFFGVSHLHHLAENIFAGLPIKKAILLSGFQFCYTTIFGMYSAFLFLRTGNVMAPIIAHSFCNHMGFPDFAEINKFPSKNKYVICISYVTGLICFCYFMFSFTKPTLFDNKIYFAN